MADIRLDTDDIVEAAIRRNISARRIMTYIGREPTEERLIWVLAYIMMDVEDREAVDRSVDYLAPYIPQFGANAAFEVIVQTNRWISRYGFTRDELSAAAHSVRTRRYRQQRLMSD